MTVNQYLSGAWGRAKAYSRPVMSSPYVTRLARPQRSARPAMSDANAPMPFAMIDAATKNVNVMS